MKMRMGFLGLILCLLCLQASPVFALGDVFDGMAIKSTRPLSSGEFIFCPGDQVVQESNYSVYYSGFQTASAEDTLLFTVFEDDRNYQVFFSSPDIITIKDVTLRIISYDNTSLKIQFIRD